MTRLAHHFSLRPPSISCIIPGARNSAQLRENVAASDGGVLAPQVRRQIETDAGTLVVHHLIRSG